MPLTIIPIKDIQHFTNYAEHHFYDTTLYLSELQEMVSSIKWIMNAIKLRRKNTTLSERIENQKEQDEL